MHLKGFTLGQKCLPLRHQHDNAAKQAYPYKYQPATYRGKQKNANTARTAIRALTTPSLGQPINEVCYWNSQAFRSTVDISHLQRSINVSIKSLTSVTAGTEEKA